MLSHQSDVELGVKLKRGFNSANLVNASNQTLFQYSIIPNTKNVDFDEAKQTLSVFDEHLLNEEQIVGPKERVFRLLNSGVKLSFYRMKSETSQENLQLIDSSLDVFLSDCLLVFMKEKMSSVAEIVQLVAKRNPCNYVVREESRLLDFYQYKMKLFIIDSAFGMEFNKAWTGNYDSSEGYMITKSSGEVIRTNLHNRNALQDYLYNHLQFETPYSTGSGSKKAFNYALFYMENDQPYMDICLQLRFK